MRPNMRVISVFFGLAGALVWAGAANGQPLPFAKQDSQLAAVPAPHISRPSISDLRVGLHPDKTRVVLDLSQPVGYTHQVSQDGTAVFIDLAEVKWRARPATARHHKGLVTEFKFAPTGKRGGRLSILAASPVSQAKSFLIPPSGKRGYRLVLDLVARKSAKPVNAFRPAKLRLPAARRINGQAGQLHLAVYKPHKPFGGDQTTPIKVRTQARPVPLSRTNGQYAQSPRSHPQPRPRAPRPPAASSNPYLKAIEKREHEMAPAADDGGGLFGIPGMYGRGDLGIGFATEASNSGGGTINDTEYELGYLFSGALGVDLENNFRIEAEINYQANDLQSVVGTISGTTVAAGVASGDVGALSFMGNVAYDFRNQTRFTPFLMGGLGLARIAYNSATANGITMSDDSDYVYALQFGGGVSVDLDEKWSLEGSYRYMETGDPSFSDANGTPFTSEFSTHNFLVGARYKF